MSNALRHSNSKYNLLQGIFQNKAMVKGEFNVFQSKKFYVLLKSLSVLLYIKMFFSI